MNILKSSCIQCQENAINDDDKRVLMDKIIETEKEIKDE